MTDFQAIPVSSPESMPRLVLGEGPVWNAASGTALWVDIVQGTVFEGSYDGARIEVLRQWQQYGRSEGADTTAAPSIGKFNSLAYDAVENQAQMTVVCRG